MFFPAGCAARPALMSRLGLEWLYRIAGQPSRWKRALRLPAFMFLAVGVRIKGKRQ